MIDADLWINSVPWKQYFCVQIYEDKKEEVCKNFAICKKCLLWLLGSYGTVTTLTRHTGTYDEAHESVKNIKINTKQYKITGYVKKSILPTVREALMQDTIYMMAHDGQPFSVV